MGNKQSRKKTLTDHERLIAKSLLFERELDRFVKYDYKTKASDIEEDDGEYFYIICYPGDDWKLGKAAKLNRRIQSYRTHCPRFYIYVWKVEDCSEVEDKIFDHIKDVAETTNMRNMKLNKIYREEGNDHWKKETFICRSPQHVGKILNDLLLRN